MSTIVVDETILHIPAWVIDHASFRRWVRSDEFPETGRVFFLNGEVWADMSKKQFFSHNQVKQEYGRVLGNLTVEDEAGRYVPDGMLLSHVEAGLTAGPDGCFFSYDSLDAGRIRLLEGAREGFVELEGSPDMVLEILSDSSVEKDTVTLRDLYWQAGIREYWLVDVREDRLEFDVLRYTARGYSATRKVGGWVKSVVFGKSFRLVRRIDGRGDPVFRLEVR